PVEDAAVAARPDLPLEFEFEVTEACAGDDVAAAGPAREDSRCGIERAAGGEDRGAAAAPGVGALQDSPRAARCGAGCGGDAGDWCGSVGGAGREQRGREGEKRRGRTHRGGSVRVKAAAAEAERMAVAGGPQRKGGSEDIPKAT